MPQDGSNNYQYPPGTPGIPDTTIESEAYNTFLDDLVLNDLNIPRPVHRGGTGASTADAALVNLKAEKAEQVVTAYLSHVWMPGSFRSAIGATDAPVADHAFAGVCYINEPLVYPPTNANVTVEARDMTNSKLYIRQKTAGVWGAWLEQAGGVSDLDAAYVNVAGDTMTGSLILPGDPVIALHAATKQYVDISRPNASVLINGDFRINQAGYVSGAVLAAGAYGHDQWKAGASGGDYSFTQLASSTQITIASGKSIIQPIENVNVSGGSYVLSWTGTAQARAGVNTLTPSGAYAASPLTIAGQTAGTVMSVEFNTGTLGAVKLESGANVTPFVMRPYDQELATCRRYYWQGTAYQLRGVVLSGVGPTGMAMTPLASFRAAPTLTVTGSIAILDGAAGTGNITSISSNSSTVDAIAFTPGVTGSTFATAGLPVVVSFGSSGILKADARL